MQEINLGKLVKKTEKKNSEVSSCSLLCGVLNCPQCSQCGMSVKADGWNTLSKQLIHTIMWFYKLHWQCTYTWGKKIDEWVHRRWHMLVDWVWGCHIELYCVNKVFWWQSEQSYVMWCRNLIHCIFDGSTWKTRGEQTLTIVKAQTTSEICQVVLKCQIWRKRVGPFGF